MAKFTLSIDFDVEEEKRVAAHRLLLEEIQQLIAIQLENKELFVALEDSEIIDIYDWNEDE